MNKELKDMNTVEIKALLYDQIVLLEQTKNNIQILQQELTKKSSEVTHSDAE